MLAAMKQYLLQEKNNDINNKKTKSHSKLHFWPAAIYPQFDLNSRMFTWYNMKGTSFAVVGWS